MNANFLISDNQGRRTGMERRRFEYSLYLPDRRTGAERRSGEDRRLKARIAEDKSNTG